MLKTILASLFLVVSLSLAVADEARKPSQMPDEQVDCPLTHWHLVSGPSFESCRTGGECHVSCPSMHGCVDRFSGQYCENALGPKGQLLCYCPN